MKGEAYLMYSGPSIAGTKPNGAVTH